MKKIFIGLGILLLVVLIYFAFFKKKPNNINQENSCPNSFTINPFSFLVPDAASVTYSKNGDKYYSQTSGGYGGYGLQLPPKEITKEKFMEACKTYKSQSANQ